jgi:TM2 domain-containing membrane protein YozV
MNCANHQDITASAFCRTCGKALCSTCSRDVRGVIYCEECIAHRLGDTVPQAPPPPYAGGPPVAPVVVRPGSGNPVLAALLSIIPGVGQMYNEQYAKGLIFVLIYAALIQLISNGLGAIGGITIAGFYIFQIIDAYKTAKARQYGLPLPDPFGINDLLGGKNKPAYSNPPAQVYQPAGVDASGAPVAVAPVQVAEEEPAKPGPPVGAIILIGLGVLFLLDSFGHFNFEWVGRFWPVILIVVGVWIFVRRRDAAAR